MASSNKNTLNTFLLLWGNLLEIKPYLYYRLNNFCL